MRLRGHMEYERSKKGEALTRKEAILAQCYVCNGLDEGGEDCKGYDCALYQYMPYRTDKKKKVSRMSAEQRRLISERLKRGRDAKKTGEAV